MKTKVYKHGTWNFKSYMKTVGRGWEVGVIFDKKPLFVGNFIHATEANQWWNTMTREFTKFCKKYEMGTGTMGHKNWYRQFFANHLYTNYYAFLDKLFYKHNRTYKKAVTRDLQKYRTLKRRFHVTDRTHFSRAA